MNRKRNRRGFTLVEIIVVLVVLAILAAILIPSMTGWIDKAQQKRLITACRTAVTAAQTLASEAYGETKTATVPSAEAIRTLAKIPGTVSGVELFNDGTLQVRHLTYTESGESVTYCAKADDHPEVYNFGLQNGFSDAAAIEAATKDLNALITGAYASDYKGNLDSTALDGPLLDKLIADKALDPLNLSGINIQSWAIRQDAGTKTSVWITDQDISTLKTGDSVRVIRYNSATGVYTAGYIKIASESRTTNGVKKTYPVLARGTGSNVWTEAAPGSADPASAVATFNALDAKK